MLSKHLSFIIVPRADQTVQLGIAEPAGSGVTNSPIFRDRAALRTALESAGLPGKISMENGLSEARRVSFLQLVTLGFF